MIKKYNHFIKESLKDKMTPKSDEEVRKLLDNLSPKDKIKKGIELDSPQIIEEGIRGLKDGDLHSDEIADFVDTAIYNESLDVVKYLIENLEFDQEHYSRILFSLQQKYDNQKGEKNKSLLDLIDWISERELSQLNTKKDYNGMLKYGCKHNNIDLVKKAIENGADVNYSKWGLLNNPINKRNFELVEYLLKQGIQLYIPGTHPRPIERAISNNDIEMTKLLQKYGAKLDTKGTSLSSFQVSRWIEEGTHKEIIEYIKDEIPGIKEEIERTIGGLTKSKNEIQSKIDRLKKYL